MSPRPGPSLPRSFIRDGVGAALAHDPLPIGGVAAGLMLGTYALFSLGPDAALLTAGVSGTALAYLVDRVWTQSPEDRVNHPERAEWVEAHPKWFAAETVVLFAAAGASVPFLGWRVLIAAVVLAGAVGLHVIPRGSGLKHGGVAKPVVIAGAWAVAGGLLPLIEASRGMGVGIVLFTVYRFLFILPNLLLADWADRTGDAAVGLRPWAREWSDRQVRWTATGLLVVALVGAGTWMAVASRPVLVGIDAFGLVVMFGVVWTLDIGRPLEALMADLVVGWPFVTAVAAWMMV